MKYIVNKNQTIAKTWTLSLLLICVFIMSCNYVNDNENQIDLDYYESIRTQTLSDLNSINNILNQRGVSFIDADETRIAVNTYYSNQIEADFFMESYDAFGLNKKGTNSDSVVVSGVIAENISEILDIAEEGISIFEFQLFIDTKFNEIVNSDYDIYEIDFLLTYLTIYQVTIDYMIENQLVGINNSKAVAKCGAAIAAGAIAGAGSGGVAGMQIGGAIGRLFGKKGEITGKGIGAIAGLIGGAIGGGIGGYAFQC